jgi:hypothetical protein
MMRRPGMTGDAALSDERSSSVILSEAKEPWLNA